MNKMIYGITEKPKTLKEIILYAAQQTLSILTATILISSICGTDVAAGMVGAGCATIIFLIATGFKAPLFFSNSGSTVSGVLLAFAGLEGNYAGIIIGGLTICIMNLIVAAVVKRVGSDWVSKILPPVIAGTIVVIIGLNLAGFCATYINSANLNEMIIAFIAMLVTVCVMRYGKGRISTLPFLFGALAGIIASFAFGIMEPIDFSWRWPQIAILHSDFSVLTSGKIGEIVLAFVALNAANLAEHISDITAVSQIVDEDLTKTVGLHKTFAGDGIADLVGCIIGGQPTTTYSESLSTIAVSRVASTFVIFVAALFTIGLGLFSPFTAFIRTIPNCVFGGIALVAYGMIAFAGLKTLHKVDISTTKNSIIIAVMLTVGISNIAFNFGNNFSLTGIALAMITGLLLNLILKGEKEGK